MKNYFCGWYFKCQSDTQTLAIIPAIHKTKDEKSCSIQVITNTASQNILFPYSAFQKSGFNISIADNHFSEKGINLNLHTPEISAVGSIHFGDFTPIKYDIMGPFRYVPFMECQHSVISMKHSVNGELIINGVPYIFKNAVGYIEGDRGRSFPKEYAWTQCSFSEGSLMLSVADIPLWGYHFTGIIGIIIYNGKEYRIATYLGAKAVKIHNGEIVIKQGNKCLTVKLLERSAHPLNAPTNGVMSRTIHENIASRTYYRFHENGDTVFEFEVDNAAFEYEYLK